MRPRFTIHLEALILGLLLAIPWPATQKLRPHCAKDQAGLVRKVVMKRWVPILQKVGATLPLQCPLHPTRDLFYPQESQKKHEAPEWNCGFCGKSFYRESHLDAHMEKRHPEEISEKEDATCLADFCDVIRCDVISEKLRELEESAGGNEESWPQNFLIATSRKSNSDQAVVKTRPRSLMVTKGSESLTARTSAHKIETSKNSFPKPNPDFTPSDAEPGEIKQNTEKNVCKGADVCPTQDGLNSSDEETKDPKELPIHPLHSWRDTCNEEHLSELRAKCQVLIQQCVSGLVLNLTLEQVKGIEAALHRTVCWYLTCDRYWEAGTMDTPDFPWGIVTFLVLLLSLGVSFSYYIVWVLCDSNSESPATTPSDVPAITSAVPTQGTSYKTTYTPSSKAGSLNRHHASTSRSKYSAAESESECRDSGFNEGGIFPEVGEISGSSYLDYENSRARHYSGDSRHSAPHDDQRYYTHEERVYNYASTFTPNYEQRRLRRNRYNYLDDFDAYSEMEPEDTSESSGIPRERSDSFIYVSYPPEIKKKFLENR